MERYILKNGIQAVIKKNINTPRSAVVLYAKLNKDENKCGTNFLMTQLMFQGTKTRTAEQLANELDENAIEIITDKKNDYIRLKLLCLNEDIEQGLELLSDIAENSTFENYEKEKIKIKGEFEADMDSPKVLAQDEYYRTIFKNHSYGTGRKEILDVIDSITKEDLLSAYNEFKYELVKNISFAGNIELKDISRLLEQYLGGLKNGSAANTMEKVSNLTGNSLALLEKDDANQAQIFKGWNVPSIYSEEYPAILVLNAILGSSGLSSRLFLELREKQGLAYTVKSVFEAWGLGGHFFVYIATEPKNIQTSLKGFDVEINKIMDKLISDEELENAKNNTIGKKQFYKETNLLEASLNGYYECINLGCDFENELIEKIKKVTKEELKEAACKYFAKPSALCILAPKKYLKDVELL